MFLLLAASAAVAAQAPDPARCDATLCNAGAIALFVAKVRAGEFEGRAPLHILQIGDSHTAGDMITAGLRNRLQARLGTGGRGVLAGGRPYAGYLTWGVTASQSGGWSINAMFGSRYQAEGAPIGISGFTQTARSAGETLGVSTDLPDQNFDRIIVCAIAQPGGGTVTLRIGTTEQSWSLAASERTPQCRTLDSHYPVSSASITTGDAGTVSIASFGTFRKEGGVVVSNLGVVGAQLTHFGRTSDALVRAELRAYRPDLIVLAFGTNEGFSPSLSADAFEAAFRAQVGRIRRLAGPDVPIMLLAAPDAGARGQGDCGDGFGPPNLLGEVRARQWRIARDLRLAFWDWSAAMGGRCSASRWRAQELMRGDHVHFSREGGDRIGALIDADIARAVSAPPPGQP